MRRRLFWRVYLTMLVALLLVLIGVGAAWRLAEHARAEHAVDAVTDFLQRNLPPADAPRPAQQRVLNEARRVLGAEVALFAADGALIAEAGRPLRFGPMHRGGGRAMAEHAPRGPPFRPAWTVPLADGRWFVTRPPPGRWRPGVALAGFVAALGIAAAAAAWPVARGLTRRLERLRAGVDQLGKGDLSTRVAVEGHDEVAALARSFNAAAARIEDLLGAHRLLLANASHELRTPLARIRMALELGADGIDPARRAHLKADIAELDQMIGEILLASRLEAGAETGHPEEVDLLALAAEEAAREGIEVEGSPASVRGDPVLLRRMIRNLIENARRHAGDGAPEVRVRAEAGRAVLEVRDHGPGIPAAERERIFTPFYRIGGSAESGRGSGLGLALVRQIAERHGGHADCLPAEPGSLFRVSLPAA